MRDARCYRIVGMSFRPTFVIATDDDAEVFDVEGAGRNMFIAIDAADYARLAPAIDRLVESGTLAPV